VKSTCYNISGYSVTSSDGETLYTGTPEEGVIFCKAAGQQINITITANYTNGGVSNPSNQLIVTLPPKGSLFTYVFS